MQKLQHGFQRIIKHIPKNSKVLDVGGGGLDGENTTNFLRERFEDITIIERVVGRVEEYAQKFGVEGLTIITKDFYKHNFDTKFDLIVLDLNIDNNIQKDWTIEHLWRVHELLNKKGIVIIYVMTTEDYGDADTPKMIRYHMKHWWASIPPNVHTIREMLDDFIYFYKVFMIAKENVRPDIIWVALQK